jgi:hypothetical protein
MDTSKNPIIPLVIRTPFDVAQEAEELAKQCKAERDPHKAKLIAFRIVDLLAGDAAS